MVIGARRFNYLTLMRFTVSTISSSWSPLFPLYRSKTIDSSYRANPFLPIHSFLFPRRWALFAANKLPLYQRFLLAISQIDDSPISNMLKIMLPLLDEQCRPSRVD